MREATAERLVEHGYRVTEAESGEAARDLLADFAFDAVITDLRLPGIDGAEVVELAIERYPEIVAVVVTGYGTVQDAVAAIKRGATDFVMKPFPFDHLLHILSTALEQRRLKSENEYLRSQLQERYRFEGIVGRSRPMRDLFQLLETVAGTTSTILITGETGTGKELVARAIHHNSPRRHQRFVAINCGAIPDALLEAELFGHVRGAFTGAFNSRPGRLEQAHRGTLFLDEIGTMSTSLAGQAAARPAGTRVRTRRRQRDPPGRRPGDRRNQRGSDAAGPGGTLPGRPVLPAERHSHPASVAARPSRGHSAARPRLRRADRGGADAAAPRCRRVAERDAPHDGVPVARQRAPTGERHRAGAGASARGGLTSTRATCRSKSSRPARNRRPPRSSSRKPVWTCRTTCSASNGC